MRVNTVRWVSDMRDGAMIAYKTKGKLKGNGR